MIIFRPHGIGITVFEAMEKAKEFNNAEEMKEHIVKIWHEGWDGSEKLFTVDDIVINERSAVNDKRIGWEDSMYVCVKRMGKKIYDVPQCIGMCATKYKKMES